MKENRNVRCVIHCQKGKQVEAEVSMGMNESVDWAGSMGAAVSVNTEGSGDAAGWGTAGVFEKDGVRLEVAEYADNGLRLGRLRLALKNESCRENFNLRMETPICVYLPVSEQPEKITAMYLYNEWWTRPAFVERLQDIPDKTQTAFFRFGDRFGCFVPMVGRAFKTCMTKGTETEICLEMTACLGGQREVDEPLYLWAEGSSLWEAVERAFAWLAEYKGIRTREKRRIPEMFRYLGWCSWDAFYTEVSEEKIREKAKELTEKNVPVKWMLIDDGWMSAQKELLWDFTPDREKFPQGFRNMIREIKQKGNIRWFGVWHALGGYWGGIAEGSPLDEKERPYLYKTVNGKLLPSPKNGERFYRDWYHRLRREEIDFVKVDGQSAIPYYFENSLPLCQAARGMNQALESGASCMDGAVINCMGMAMENILARPASAISRNSDDFVPGKENGFGEHLLQNAYNAVYHNELYCCDWDMFWTKHEDCVKHSLLRAISGGPVYFSDRIGDTDAEVIKPLAYTDGRILMMDRSARPTQDCVFSDPMERGVLKMHNTASWGGRKGGGIAAYNLTSSPQRFAFCPQDIPDLENSEKYWLFDYFQKKSFCLYKEEKYEDSLDKDGFAWYVILPQGKNCTCLGLADKYAGFSAVESIHETDNTTIAVIRESGTLAWLSEREPRSVTVNAFDVTDRIQKKDKLYSIIFPESACKTVLSIVW